MPFPLLPYLKWIQLIFCKGLLESEEVAVVPGTAFGESGAGFVRASFSTSYERILEASNRIERYLEHIS